MQNRWLGSAFGHSLPIAPADSRSDTDNFLHPRTSASASGASAPGNLRCQRVARGNCPIRLAGGLHESGRIEQVPSTEEA